MKQADKDDKDDKDEWFDVTHEREEVTSPIIEEEICENL